jgi:hypothetical protein
VDNPRQTPQGTVEGASHDRPQEDITAKLSPVSDEPKRKQTKTPKLDRDRGSSGSKGGYQTSITRRSNKTQAPWRTGRSTKGQRRILPRRPPRYSCPKGGRCVRVDLASCRCGCWTAMGERLFSPGSDPRTDGWETRRGHVSGKERRWIRVGEDKSGAPTKTGTHQPTSRPGCSGWRGLPEGSLLRTSQDS